MQLFADRWLLTQLLAACWLLMQLFADRWLLTQLLAACWLLTQLLALSGCSRSCSLLSGCPHRSPTAK
jgi:hypothetical protein